MICLSLQRFDLRDRRFLLICPDGTTPIGTEKIWSAASDEAIFKVFISVWSYLGMGELIFYSSKTALEGGGSISFLTSTFSIKG
jgi:hypothetical protein